MSETVRPVKLGALSPADLDAVHELLSDWRVVRHMLLPHCTSREESRKCLDDLMADNSDCAWQSIVRAIETGDGSHLVGLCGIAVLRGSEQGEIW